MSVLLGIELTRDSAVLTLVSRRGELECSLCEPLATPLSEWWQAHPDEYFRAIERLLGRAARDGITDARVAAIGLAAEGGIVILDRELTPLGPRMLSWQDIIDEAGSDRARPVMEVLGRRGIPGGAGTLFSLLDYMRFKMSGALATHRSFAWSTGFVPVACPDVWQAAELEAAGIPPRLLPPIFSAENRIGVIAPELSALAGVPGGVWINAGSDPVSARLFASGEPRPERRVALFHDGNAGVWSRVPRGQESAIPLAGPDLWYGPASDLPGQRSGGGSGARELAQRANGLGLELVLDAGSEEPLALWLEELNGHEDGARVRVAVDAGGPSAGPAIQAGLGLGWWRDVRGLWRKQRRPLSFAEWREACAESEKESESSADSDV